MKHADAADYVAGVVGAAETSVATTEALSAVIWKLFTPSSPAPKGNPELILVGVAEPSTGTHRAYSALPNKAGLHLPQNRTPTRCGDD